MKEYLSEKLILCIVVVLGIMYFENHKMIYAYIIITGLFINICSILIRKKHSCKDHEIMYKRSFLLLVNIILFIIFILYLYSYVV